MSNFKYCPMCGTQREDGSQFCKNCNFEFLVGKYVKLDDENSSQDEIITTEKVSQEEFVESNEMLRQTKKKINCCIAKYLNYELTNQYFIQWIGENRGHLPGMVLNQYKVPIQSNIDSLKDVISLDMVDSDENEKFKDLLNEYLKFENEFLENLI